MAKKAKEQNQKKIVKLSAEEQAILVEKEIRRCVKKDGGFRKDLPEADKKHCIELLKGLGRPEADLKWNTEIVIAGMDKPTVANINYT